MSWLTEMEASGKKFYNNLGVETECMALLKSLNVNAIRLRVWVNPANSYNSLSDVIAKAIRAKNLGLKLMIDFHYSDTWADPANQTKPLAWSTQTITQLQTSIATHTTDVLNALKNVGVTPTWVQVGNETNNGMLWPEGKASTNMANFALFINAGYNAVKSIFANTKVVVHISNGWDNNLFRWLFDGLKNNNAKWDIIGMSIYPQPTNWIAMNNNCIANINDIISRYNKEIMITEIGMSWDASIECKNFIADLITKCKNIQNNKVLGIFYWEPESYGNWQGYTKGAFDNMGKPTMAFDAYK